MVFKGLSIHIASQSRTGEGGLIREIKIPVQKLWLKMGGGLIHERGVLAGHYGLERGSSARGLELLHAPST